MQFFGAAPAVLGTLRRRGAANALELARHGPPREPFYLTGPVGGRPVSLHAAVSYTTFPAHENPEHLRRRLLL